MELFEILADTPWLLTGSVFVLSLLVGSFLNVVIYRLPIMLDRQWRAQAEEMLGAEPSAPPPIADSPQPSSLSLPPTAESPLAPGTYNLVTPRSTCPHCNAAIKAHQNIPVLSYLLLGGKCANCGAPISARYPTVELVTAILSAAVAWHFGWHWQTVAALCFTWALVALTVIDLDHQILPDVITLPLLWLGLLLSLGWHAGLTPPIPVDPRSAIIGGAAGYLSLWLVYWAFKLATGKEGMGYGDFKLFGAFGAWMGWQMLPLIILLSAATGAVVGIALIVLRGRDRNIPIPFGPYLAAAGWIALMWGPQIVGGYLSLAGLD
ncbi:MAG: A24 family peptidase, partial [Alphaproteobacteria bacterium]|nr:A24 family peptidase [Alphaproteobacteria bacterium]